MALLEDTCPHCGRRMLIRHGVRLPPKLADMFDAIAGRGANGLTCETMAWMFYPNKSKRQAAQCVAANIVRLNDLLVETEIQISRSGRGQEPYKVEARPE